MNFTGRTRLPAPRQRVWNALNDIAMLQRCIPGCQDLTAVSENAYQAAVKTRIGPLSARFKTDICLQDVRPPEHYTMVVTGSGGAVGSGHGAARVVLSEAQGHTDLEYTVELKVRGRLAQIGSRLLANSLKKLSEDFFRAFAASFDD